MAAKKTAQKMKSTASSTKKSTRSKKGSAGAEQKNSDNFLEQTMSNFEERARKEMDDLKERLEGSFEEVSSRATRTTSKLEDAFDKRVAMAYNRLGLPSKADIEALAAKIDALQRTVAALQADSAKKIKPVTKKSATKKSAARKASTKKAARKKTASGKKSSAKKAAR